MYAIRCYYGAVQRSKGNLNEEQNEEKFEAQESKKIEFKKIKNRKSSLLILRVFNFSHEKDAVCPFILYEEHERMVSFELPWI